MPLPPVQIITKIMLKSINVLLVELSNMIFILTVGRNRRLPTDILG